jgi:L,D-transpeptidase-like protein
MLLANARSETRWAPVARRTVARVSPDRAARELATLRAVTPEGTANVVVVTAVARSRGTLWARVELPILPNGTEGWIPRAALGGYGFVPTRLVIDQRRLVATLYRAGRIVFRAPIGVGQSQWPTPPGRFYVREKLTTLRSPFYGPIAFGTNARSPVLTDWPGGGFIGIHGTDRPDLIPGRISHGCVRLRNADILRLARLMPVGTPVRIT